MKYRVHHCYADSNSYDHIDISTKKRAMEHFKKSRSAKDIFELSGNRLGRQISPRTGKPMY